jgi:WXG100 family type VII secretion target
MGEKIEVSYEDLARIASAFANGAQSVEQMLQAIRQGVDNLHSTWEGRGADSFFREMDDMVYPGMKKLDDGLNQANQVCSQLAGIFQQAETEASGLFNKD